jgi:hypothetical protein
LKIKSAVGRVFSNSACGIYTDSNMTTFSHMSNK